MPRGVAPSPVGVVHQALCTLDVGSATMSSDCSSSGGRFRPHCDRAPSGSSYDSDHILQRRTALDRFGDPLTRFRRACSPRGGHVRAVGSGARLGRMVRSARPTVARPAGRFGAAASVHVSGPGSNRRCITASRARRVRPGAGCRDRAVAGRCFRRRPATHSPEGGWPVRYPMEGRRRGSRSSSRSG